MFKTDEQLGEEIEDAMLAVGVYNDPGTKAQILIPAISAARILARRARCCRPHRTLGLLNVAQLWCMRQLFLRVSWSWERIGTGWTIEFWRWLGRVLCDAEKWTSGWAKRSGCGTHREGGAG